MIQDRRAIAQGREQNQTPAACAIHAHLLAVREAEPAGLIMRVGETVGAGGGPPLGVGGEINDADLAEINGILLEGNREEAIMDGECASGESVAGRAPASID